ncbi:hypothetical protein MUO65_05840 [bacterium]|nr:hypothetical protein [bacterium]
MTSIITNVGKKQIELRPYKNYTIPLMPSSYYVGLLNTTQKMGYIPPIELIEKELYVKSKSASICQYEKSLIRGGLLVGDRRKATIKISENSYLDKPVAGTLLTLSDFEQGGEKNYIHSTYSESEITDLTARLKEETGIEQERVDLQIDILRIKGYLREDQGYLILNQEKWMREKLVVKEINEKGLEKYNLPLEFVFDEDKEDFSFIVDNLLPDRFRAQFFRKPNDFVSILDTVSLVFAILNEKKIKEYGLWSEFEDAIERGDIPAQILSYAISEDAAKKILYEIAPLGVNDLKHARRSLRKIRASNFEEYAMKFLDAIKSNKSRIKNLKRQD